MHILFAVHGYKPAYRFGGPIWSVSSIAEELVARGHRVTVFTTSNNLDQVLNVPEDQPVDVNGVSVWYFKVLDLQGKYLFWSNYFSQSMGFLYTPALRAALRYILPSVTIVHTQMPYIYPGMIAGRQAIRAGKPLFYNQRGVYHPDRLNYRGLKKALYINLIEKPIMRRASGLIALNEEEVASFRRLGIETPCHIVPNGVDVDRFRRIPRPDSLARFGIPASARVILFLGRLHSTKGIDVALQAFFLLADSQQDAVLVLAGPDEHDIIMNIRTEVAQRGLSERVIFTDMVVGDEKLDLLARADLFVLPSLGEGQSIAVLEALASGTPVIISPECNYSVVEQVGAGVVVDRDPAKTAAAIVRYLANPDLVRAASDAAYSFARDKLGWKSIVDRLEEIYSSTTQ